MAARKITAFLIYRAADASLRVVTRRPNLAWDEVAFTVEVTVPDPWGRLAGSVLIELPDNGPAIVEVVQPPVTS
jgi:hypothetical protein